MRRLKPWLSWLPWGFVIFLIFVAAYRAHFFPDLILKNGPWVDVRAHGAVLDGVTDDSTAFFNAIQAADGKPVYIPPGPCLLSTIASKTITKDIILIGAGPNVSILDGNGNQAIKVYNGKKVHIQGIKFQDFNTAITQQNSSDITPEIKVYNSEFTGGAYGISLDCKVTYADISHSKFYSLTSTGACVALRLGTNTYADQAYSKKYMITHNTFDSIVGTGDVEVHAILLYGKEVIVEDNIIDTVNSSSGSKLAVEGIYTKALYGSISRNIMTDAGHRAGAIAVKGTRRGETTSPQGFLTTVSGNILVFKSPGNTQRGISIHTDDVLVTKNQIEGADYGITLQGNFEQENISIVDNKISNPGYAAISAGDYGSGLKIADNQVYNPGGAYAVTNAYGIMVASNNGNLLNASVQDNQVRILSSTQATNAISAFYFSSSQAGSYTFKIDDNVVNIEGAVTPTVYGMYITGMDGANAWHDVSMQKNVFVGCDTDYYIYGGLSSTLDDWKIEPHKPGAVSTMSGNEVFTIADGRMFIKDPGGAARTFNPSGAFPPLYEITIVNTADAAETITFDSAGLNQSIAQNQRGIFVYDGSAWLKVYVGS